MGPFFPGLFNYGGYGHGTPPAVDYTEPVDDPMHSSGNWVSRLLGGGGAPDVTGEDRRAAGNKALMDFGIAMLSGATSGHYGQTFAQGLAAARDRYDHELDTAHQEHRQTRQDQMQAEEHAANMKQLDLVSQKTGVEVGELKRQVGERLDLVQNAIQKAQDAGAPPEVLKSMHAAIALHSPEKAAEIFGQWSNEGMADREHARQLQQDITDSMARLKTPLGQAELASKQANTTQSLASANESNARAQQTQLFTQLYKDNPAALLDKADGAGSHHDQLTAAQLADKRREAHTDAEKAWEEQVKGDIKLGAAQMTDPAGFKAKHDQFLQQREGDLFKQYTGQQLPAPPSAGDNSNPIAALASLGPPPPAITKQFPTPTQQQAAALLAVKYGGWDGFLKQLQFQIGRRTGGL